LDRLTARHTFAIREYLKILEEEEEVILNGEKGATARLDQLTITTRTRPKVKHDFKHLTGLNTSQLQNCARTVLSMWNSYKTHLANWEKRIEKISYKKALKALVTLSIEGEDMLAAVKLDGVIGEITSSRFYKKVLKENPSTPTSKSNGKIPSVLTLNSNIPPFLNNDTRFFYCIEGKKITIKLSTLQQGKTLELVLVGSDYHIRTLRRGRFTGGRLVKNRKKHRWEFHMFVKSEKQVIRPASKKQVVIGADLGIKTDIAMAVMVEGEPLKQERLFLLKEGEMRKRLFKGKETH